MRQTKSLVIIFLALINWNICANETKLTKDTLKVYLSMTNTDEFYDELFQTIVKQNSKNGEVKTDFEAVFKQPIIDKVLPFYSKHYSEQDVLKIIEFMSSPVGKKMKKVSLDINEKVFGLVGELKENQEQNQSLQ